MRRSLGRNQVHFTVCPLPTKICTTGWQPAGCGSKVREGWIAPTTSTVIARLEAAGSFRIGALHMAEFAYGPTGHNVQLHARNPWNVDHHRRIVLVGLQAARLRRCWVPTRGLDPLPAHFVVSPG
jgi:aspartyl-tRNA(Asn)/glutamyl-tRNA(Gln) amidotransferase subunit A